MIFKKLLSDPDEVTKKVFDSIKLKEPLLLTYFNQHCFNVYHEDQEYRKIIDTNFHSYQADLGVYLAAKFLNHSDPRRIESTAMNANILNALIKYKIPIVIVGGNFEEKFIRDAADEKGINLIYYLNGFFDDTDQVEIINQLNNLDAQVFFIGMGVPKQELFAERLYNSSTKKVIICVGNFFEYYFGTKKRAPVLFQKFGLEWLFRLFSEPGRLWKRYIIGIPEFTYRVAKIKIGKKVT